MAISKIIPLLLLFCTLNAAEPNRVLYLIRQGHFVSGIDLYTEIKEEKGEHDLEMVQQIALTLLDLGWRCNDHEIQLLSIFGAGISAHDRSQYILEDALSCKDPQFQAISLNFLSRINSDDAHRILNKAMASDLLQIRVEAAFHMAQNQHPKAPYQIESLIQKVPPQVLPLFPQLLGMCGDRKAIVMLRRLMNHPVQPVRIAAMLSAAQFGRDDLLPEIRTLSTHHRMEEQEASSVALGILKDEKSVDRLRKLSKAPTVSVRLAALQSLYRLGRDEVGDQIIQYANNGNLFAISILSEIKGSDEHLFKLTQSKDINIRANAAIALLEKNDSRCLPALAEILIRGPRDLALTQFSSIGKGLTAFKVIPSAQQNLSSNQIAYELSLKLREQILQKTLELPEQNFLELSELLFKLNQNELIPTLTHLLENLQSERSIAILKRYREKFGAPLIRNWCNLALYRMREEGPYAETLTAWIDNYQLHDLIQFRPLIPWEMRDGGHKSKYQLTPHDASRLLVETFESLVQTQNEEGIDLLLSAIKNGNRHNRYALAGLLIRATN